MNEIEKRIEELEKTGALSFIIKNNFNYITEISNCKLHISEERFINTLKEIISFGEKETLEIVFIPYSLFNFDYNILKFQIFLYKRRNTFKKSGIYNPGPEKIVYLEFLATSSLDSCYYDDLWTRFKLTLDECLDLINKKYFIQCFTGYSESSFDPAIFLNLENVNDPCIKLAELSNWNDEPEDTLFLMDRRFNKEQRIVIDKYRLQYLLRNKNSIGEKALEILKRNKKEYEAKIAKIKTEYEKNLEVLTSDELLLLEID